LCHRNIEQERRSVATEQDAWRAVHVAAAGKGLDDRQTADLRLWAARRMKEVPGAVWRYSAPSAEASFVPAPLRPSFSTALGHAADDLIAGRQPE
jgi:hypothetical protein